MPTRREIRETLGKLGELLEEHDDGADLEVFTEYRDRPVAFVREVIGDEPWSRQVDVLEAVRDHRNVAVRSCNGAGKSHLAAWLALWWCYARQGLAVITANTEQQLTEQIMRRYLWQQFSKARPELPGTLHTTALRPHGEGAAGVVAKTATGVSALTGWHDSSVLYVIDEAQDYEKLDPHAWDAAFAVATGEEDRKLALGNPVFRAGRFYRAAQPGSNWKAIRIPASEVPNVREGRTVIPGLITREAIDDMAREYGRDSDFYRARAEALFPVDDDEGLFRRSDLEKAAERWKSGAPQMAEHDNRSRWTLGVDVARKGSDATVVATRRGSVLEGFESWRGAELGETADRVDRLALEVGGGPFDPDPACRQIVVDAVGFGASIYEDLRDRERAYKVTEYKGSNSAKAEDRFRNRRAEAYWKLSRKLAEGELAIPDDEEFFEELLAVRWRDDGTGRVVLERKKDLQKRLGRSPDKADAAAMAFGKGTRERVTEVVQWG